MYFIYGNALKTKITHWNNLKSNLRVSNDHPNQTAVIRSSTFHALVQALRKVRMWIFGIMYCSYINIQHDFLSWASIC